MQVANIYDNGPISPVARIKDNLAIWTSGKWEPYQIQFIEPIPRSSPLRVDFVDLSGAVTVAANGTIARQLAQVLRLSRDEFLHLRWYPIDDMEGILWEQSSQGRYSARSVQARVNLWTEEWDPWLATTTFFILGMNRDANFEIRNPMGIAWPQARFVFFGYRYVLDELDKMPAQATYLPAEGMVS